MMILTSDKLNHQKQDSRYIYFSLQVCLINKKPFYSKILRKKTMYEMKKASNIFSHSFIPNQFLK